MLTFVLLLCYCCCSVVSNSLPPRGLQHARLPYPSPSPWISSISCPLSQWCHSTILSSAVPFSSCFHSFPASGSFSVSWLFSSGGQSIGASASASVLSMNIQDWFSLGLTVWYCKKKIFPLGYNIFLKVGEVCLLLLFFYITSSLCIIDTGVGLSLYLTSMHTPLTLSPSVHTRHIHLHCRAQPASPSASRNQVDLKILADSFIWLWKISQTPQTLAPWAGRKKAGWKRGVLD